MESAHVRAVVVEEVQGATDSDGGFPGGLSLADASEFLEGTRGGVAFAYEVGVLVYVGVALNVCGVLRVCLFGKQTPEEECGADSPAMGGCDGGVCHDLYALLV